jgi:diguanylate cyclase (GGDEF)-like protein
LNLLNYLDTGNNAFLDGYRTELVAVAGGIGNLEAVDREMAVPDSMLGTSTKQLSLNLAEWQKGYATIAIGYKNRKPRPAYSALSALNRKGTGPRLAVEIDSALNFVKGHADQTYGLYRSRMRSRQALALAGIAAGLALIVFSGVLFSRRLMVMLSQSDSRGERLEMLADYAEKIQHAVSPAQAAQDLAAAVGKNADGAVVLLLSGDGSLDIAASGKGGDQSTPVHDDPSLCPVVRTGQRFAVGDSTHERRCDCAISPDASGAYSCLPLTAQGRVAGVLHARFPPGPLSRTAVEDAAALARITSLALNSLISLDNARTDAVTDQLTGAYNRRFLDGFLEKQAQFAVRQKLPLGILMLDLDRFKAFNDRHGHQAGDFLLRSFVLAISGCVREGDLVARYGGEEFTVVLPNTDRKMTLEIAERIRSAAENISAPELKGVPPPVATVSIGLAVAPEDGRHSSALLGAADAALYRAKESGRNRIVTAS